MSGRTPPSYDHRLSINITRQMSDRLNQIASTRDEAISEIAREALRLFLDNQEDLIASRKHFSKSFQQRLDHTDWQMSILLHLVCNLTSVMMSVIMKEDYPSEEVLQFALKQAQADDWQHDLHNAHRKGKTGKEADQKTNRQLG
jgi:predicted DNA-binding protein